MTPLTKEERKRIFVETKDGPWLAEAHRGWNDAAKFEILARYEASLSRCEAERDALASARHQNIGQPCPACGSQAVTFRVDASVPPNEVHAVQDGKIVAKIVNVDSSALSENV